MKCLIDYKIINPDETIEKRDIKAIYTEDKISYIDDKDSISIILSNNNIIMTKDNFSSKTTLNFIKDKKTDSEYFIKSLNSKLNVKVKTNILEITHNKIYIEYEIWFEEEYSGKFTYDLCIKEM
ncbi:MAG: DUF1934 family protein [Bacilli bacterium]|nr:DUF1934 family protein [Bacilli bacterium]